MMWSFALKACHAMLAYLSLMCVCAFMVDINACVSGLTCSHCYTLLRCSDITDKLKQVKSACDNVALNEKGHRRQAGHASAV
jgi:hypothetical protein